jgi:hypothetical protein
LRRAVGQIDLLFRQTAPGRGDRNKQKTPARKNSFHEPFQSCAKIKANKPKFSTCDFQKIMNYYAHPALLRGALRAFRHDT